MPTATKRDKVLLFGITGRDGSTPDLETPDNRCKEALNVDFFRSSVARKRGGAANLSLTGGTAWTGVVSSIFSHLPSPDQTLRELWGIDDAATPALKRLAGGTAWADVAMSDACQTKPWEVNWCSFNGKLFVAYNSSVNRLHEWDGTSFIRSGLDKSSVPTVADTGAGTYAATIRYYKVRWVTIVSSAVIRSGDLSAAVSFTPSGTGTHARLTQPTAPGESETHWEVYGSPDNANFFRLAQVLEATTTYDDNTNPAAYSGTLAPDAGAFTAAPSAKYLLAIGKRMLMAGAWETAAGNGHTPKANRFWWTSPLGATDNGDDERVSNSSTIKAYDDVDEDITGLGGPINGSAFIFSYYGMWKAVETPVVNNPFKTFRIAGALGTIQHKTIVKAVDEKGEHCLYWLSSVGPCRFGSNGFELCNEDIADIWDGVNLGASNVVAHGVHHPDKHQIWWWIATGSSNDPDTKIVFDTKLGRIIQSGKDVSVRNGWSKHGGNSAAARCSTMMSDTVAASMGVKLKPYIGRSTSTLIWKCDTGTTDAGTTFQAYIQSKHYMPWGLGNLGNVIDSPTVAAGAVAATSLQLGTAKDFETSFTNVSVSIAPDATEAHVIKKADDTTRGECKSIQIQIGDSAAADSAWNVDAVLIPVTYEGRSS